MTTPNTHTSYTLPAGITTRPLTLEDAEIVAQFSDAHNAAKGYPSVADVEDIKVDWQAPKFNLAESSLAIFAEDGELIGYGTLWDNSEIPVKPRLNWVVRDDLYGSGIDQYLMQWLENKAERVIEKCPPDAKITIGMSVLEGYQKRMDAIASAGYEHKRSWYRMLIDMTEQPPAPSLPENILMRPMNYPDEFRDVAIADRDAFRDHYGYVEEPIDEMVKEWQYYIDKDPIFTPDVYHIAVDTNTGQITGVCLCRMEQWGKPDTAYVESVGVIPAYRRQGIAQGMLYHAFNDFWERGRKKVALHVDATSLTGATRLYERVGMHVAENWMSYNKVLRDGVSYTTEKLGDNQEQSE
ncbi:MAG: GNAT family N-acetyltransferase [Chloroflexota bacterium]